jgi:NAD(P)-dependent dehydrogenase (short-subunit alcohol dehydrogenase family)
MSNPKWTTDDIADLTGRVAVVTGANTGLGLETARELAAKNATVVLAVRDRGKGETARADIAAGVPDAAVSVQALDLASLESIRSAAVELHERFDAIDLLVNNAGVMFTPKSTTADGFELQLGVNHLGHFALTGLLLDLMLAVEGSRIVTVSSGAHKFKSPIDFADLAGTDGYNRTTAYARSKVANLLFTYELQHRLATAGAPTIALAAHPGGSNTELGRNAPAAMRALGVMFRPFMQSAAMGALPTLRAASDPAAVGGQYYGPDGFGEFRGHPVLVESNERSHDPELQRRLWDASGALTGVTFPV